MERGLSMTQLAASAGLSRAMISFVEHEKRNPTLDTLLRITAVLDVNLSDILVKAAHEVEKTTSQSVRS
jgi:transcriptional regulator with XRE-family HTH domain